MKVKVRNNRYYIERNNKRDKDDENGKAVGHDQINAEIYGTAGNENPTGYIRQRVKE